MSSKLAENGGVDLATRAEGFGFLTQALWAVDTVNAASQLGVFELLDSRSVTPAELSEEVGMTLYQSRVLLASLRGLGLTTTDDSSQSTAAVEGLDGIVRNLLGKGELVDVLSGGQPLVSAETADGSRRLYPSMVRFLASGFEEAGVAAAAHLARPGIKVLDIGAGAAPWSLAVAARYSDIGVVALDLPDVIDVTRSAVEDAGLLDRFEVRSADVFETEIESGEYDLVIAGLICHLFDDETNRRLLKLASNSLAPGGTLAIVEPLVNETLDGPRAVLLYALNLCTRTSGGGVYPFSTYVSWLKGSGLEGIHHVGVSEVPPLNLITAHRRQRETPCV